MKSEDNNFAKFNLNPNSKMNTVSQFMYYMLFRWNLEEAIRIYGQALGTQIYSQWYYNNSRDKTMNFYQNLEEEERELLIKRAREIYDERGNER